MITLVGCLKPTQLNMFFFFFFFYKIKKIKWYKLGKSMVIAWSISIPV